MLEPVMMIRYPLFHFGSKASIRNLLPLLINAETYRFAEPIMKESS
jgi:hypothetical protein